MKVLVINCGSSSIKYQLHDVDNRQVLARGIVARIGEEGSYIEYEVRGSKLRREIPIQSHRSGFELMVESLLDYNHGVIRNLSEISAVGHRTVHGGNTFTGSTLITEDVIKKMETCVPLAPLHNPANLMGIKEARRIFPNVPHVAVFDTAFHQTMPPKAYLYALPYEYYENYEIRRYGFHGTSCRYVSQRTAELLNRTPEELKMVICHLGNGVTIDAVSGGKSIDTSLGFTPLPGVMMGTRCGDIDPGVIIYMHRQLGLSLDRIDNILNRESGLLAVSGVSNDMRVIIENAMHGNERCRLAMEMFTYQVKKFVGAYAAAMGGIDALVFTAGIGENSPLIRAMVCEGLGFLGVKIDEAKNSNTLGMERIISSASSTVKVLVVPTNEEQVIVQDTIALAFGHTEIDTKGKERQ